MKKLFLILAIIITYTVSTSNVKANVAPVEKAKTTTVAADAGVDAVFVVEIEKDKKKDKKKVTKKACCGEAAAKTTAKAGCSEAQKKSCAASGKTCGGEKTATTAKSCCGDKAKK